MSEERFECESLVEKLPVIQSIFSSKQEAIEYCKEFQNIGKVWALYHVAQFSFFLGKIKEVYNKLDDYSRALMDINRLVMIASMIELLNSEEDFIRFDKWIEQEGKDKPLDIKGVVAIWHCYNKIHGSANKFRRFFDKYLTKDEKIGLIKSVQFWKPEEKSFFPLFCFKGDACNAQHSYCTFDMHKEECPAQKSDRVTHSGIEECANFLYTLRSEFVHEAKLFFLPKPLPEGVGGSSWVVDYLEYDFSTKDYSHRASVMLELFSNQLVILVEKYLKKLMKDYLEIRQSSTTTSGSQHQLLSGHSQGQRSNRVQRFRQSGKHNEVRMGLRRRQQDGNDVPDDCTLFLTGRKLQCQLKGHQRFRVELKTTASVTITYVTDLNRDKTVNILDIFIVANTFGSKPEDPNWNAVADLNKDRTVNIFDLFTVARDFGKTV